MRETLDLSILKEKPSLDTKVILDIQPLAPLSMVNDLPGSYYKTLKSPNKKMLCGLFENILEWHIDSQDRNTLIKEIKKLRKKQKVNFNPIDSGSTYQPLIAEYFEIELPVYPSPMHFDDFWKRAYRRDDAYVHPKGTPNLDYSLIAQKRKLKRDDKKPDQPDNKALTDFFTENIGKFPTYFTTPTKREYIEIKGEYKIGLSMDFNLFSQLKTSLQDFNISYLGNSEGWVHVKIEKK